MKCGFCQVQRREQVGVARTRKGKLVRSATKSDKWVAITFEGCGHTVAVAKGASDRKVTRVMQSQVREYKARQRKG